MTSRTQQRFYAIDFHERRVGGTRSPKENPAEVPLAAKDRVGAPLSKGPFGRDGISTVRILVERPGDLKPWHPFTERRKCHLHEHIQREYNNTQPTELQL